jgi:hypothetical protein
MAVMTTLNSCHSHWFSFNTEFAKYIGKHRLFSRNDGLDPDEDKVIAGKPVYKY